MNDASHCPKPSPHDCIDASALLTPGVETVISALHAAVAAAHQSRRLDDVAHAMAMALREVGLPVDRLQLPLSFIFGFKHPVYAGQILTWSVDRGSETWLRPHGVIQRAESLALVSRSPYAPVLLENRPSVRLDQGTPEWDTYPLLRELESRGFTSYIAIAAPLPDGARQVLSVATLRGGGFDAKVPESLAAVAPMISLALYGLYQAQTARQIASTYLGRRTGERVLDGEMSRGQSAHVNACVAFVDVRGFTRLCIELGIERMVEYVNTAFAVLDSHVRRVGGEILKFMGDAALVVFPSDVADVAPCFDILGALLDAIHEAHSVTEAQGQALRLAAGLHYGDVMYGNIGAEGRHDFTVMGPSVNLASRLEQLTKRLDCCVAVSTEFVIRCSESCGTRAEAELRLDATVIEHKGMRVDGIEAPLTVWAVHANARSGRSDSRGGTVPEASESHA